MTEQYLPQERDLPTGRLMLLKDELMTQIEDLDTESPAHRRRRWPRITLAAAALVAIGLAVPVMLGDEEPASANTAMRTDDGIIITINEGKHPKDLERRLNDLGVPAVVDFLESGFGCDRSRSTGWVQDPPGEDLFASVKGPKAEYVLHPDGLVPGETVVFEFQIDEHEGDIASMVTTNLSTTAVGECVQVPNGSVVDAENGIVGG